MHENVIYRKAYSQSENTNYRDGFAGLYNCWKSVRNMGKLCWKSVINQGKSVGKA